MQQQTHGGDIGDGIHGAYLVKVDVLHGNAVNMAFRLCDFLVNRQNVQLHHGGEGQTADNAPDIRQMTVVVMVAIFFLAVNRYLHVGSQNAAFFAFFRCKTDAGYSQPVQFLHKSILIRH